MVQISIHALRNLNHGGRFFPYSGYLGLTKLIVEGVIRTRLDDDHKLLPAYSVTVSVKCYEARTKLTYCRLNTLFEATNTLWASPSPQESAEIGDMELPFRLVLPSTAPGHSTLSFPDYKVFWRLEASASLFFSRISPRTPPRLAVARFSVFASRRVSGLIGLSEVYATRQFRLYSDPPILTYSKQQSITLNSLASAFARHETTILVSSATMSSSAFRPP